MGFKVNRVGYTLKFADGSPLDGATVIMASATAGDVLGARRTAVAVNSENEAEQADAIAKQLELVASKLMSWDLEEEDGTPIPATKDGVMSLEIGWVFHIQSAWLKAVTGGVDVPLPDASSDGEKQALEASIPMELSPTSLAS